MISVAIRHLHTYGVLSQQQLLNELNGKRSAFVCALLALLPGVEVASIRPIQVRLAEGRE